MKASQILILLYLLSLLSWLLFVISPFPSSNEVGPKISSVASTSESSSPFVGKPRWPRVFVYELPCKWTSCSIKRKYATSFENEGLGPKRSDGLYNTNPWFLEVIMHTRPLRSAHRTRDSLEADLFYIPLYLTAREVGEIEDGTSSDALEFLRRNYESWNRTQGERHFTTAGRTWGGIIGRREYEKSPLSANLDFLTIEKVSWRRYVKSWTNITRVYPIPYPSVYHYSLDLGIPSRFPWSPHTHPRPWLVAYISSPKSELRKVLTKQCQAWPNLCNAGSAEFKDKTWMQDFLDVYNHSVFCLQPPGDTPTRKGIFDSIAIGCIPVLFSPHSAEKQYTWHLPNIGDYSIYIPQSNVLERGLDVFHTLASIPDNKVKNMQDALSKVAFRTQYAMDDPPEELGDDAVEVILKSLMEKKNA